MHVNGKIKCYLNILYTEGRENLQSGEIINTFVFRKIPLFVKQYNTYGLSNTQYYPCLDNVWTEASDEIIFQI